MIKPFEYTEVLSTSDFNDNTSVFNLNNILSPKLVLLRGIVGSIRLHHTLSQTNFEQNVDYLDLQGINAGKSVFERLKEYISEDLSNDDIFQVFKNQKYIVQNNDFFESLCNEFNNFYYYENKGSHTTAFAFIYRILETISYAFPLTYAVKTNNFQGTYSLLKGYLNGVKDKGELGFFKKFIQELFKDDPAPESSITIEINHPDVDIQKAFFKSFKKACPDPNLYDPNDTDEPNRISIKFTEYSSFVINLRNRFFHFFNSGQPNLHSSDIMDADSFFGMVNKKSVYWISVVLFQIIKVNIESFL